MHRWIQGRTNSGGTVRIDSEYIDGGILTETAIELTVSETGDSINGTIYWTYSDGINPPCTGQSDVVITRAS